MLPVELYRGEDALRADRAAVLHVESRISIDRAPADFRADDIADHARTCPFAYAADEGAELAVASVHDLSSS